MVVFVVMRFDPMQCGACGNGKLDKIFMEREEAQAYISNSSSRRGVSWQIVERAVEEHSVLDHGQDHSLVEHVAA